MRPIVEARVHCAETALAKLLATFDGLQLLLTDFVYLNLIFFSELGALTVIIEDTGKVTPACPLKIIDNHLTGVGC